MLIPRELFLVGGISVLSHYLVFSVEQIFDLPPQSAKRGGNNIYQGYYFPYFYKFYTYNIFDQI